MCMMIVLLLCIICRKFYLYFKIDFKLINRLYFKKNVYIYYGFKEFIILFVNIFR